jgi:hypothetical protein
MAQQKLRQPMAGAQQIGAHVFATPQQIPRRLFLVGRNMDRGERTGPIQDRQLPRIAAIGFDAIARTTRDQRRGDELAWNRVGGQRALQLEAAGPRFIAAPHRSLAT